VEGWQHPSFEWDPSPLRSLGALAMFRFDCDANPGGVEAERVVRLRLNHRFETPPSEHVAVPTICWSHRNVG
jgi:hypothetical protein